MPLYRCMVTEGLISYDQRSRISKEITRIHCEVTGAPPKFVHTVFSDNTGGELPRGSRVVVFGTIRAGRTEGQKQSLVAEMTASIAEIASVPESEIVLATVDVPASWVMEGGDVLPEPGEEEAWLAKHD